MSSAVVQRTDPVVEVWIRIKQSCVASRTICPWEPHNFDIIGVVLIDSDCPGVIAMALMQIRTQSFGMEDQREGHLMPVSTEMMLAHSSSSPPAVAVTDVSVDSMDLDDAIPQVIILIEQFWGYDTDDDDFTVGSGVLEYAEQSNLPSEATIQVLKTFFDGIEDQMDVEDELLCGRPEEASSVVSDLSPATRSTATSSSSSSSFQGWIPSFLLDGDEIDNV